MKSDLRHIAPHLILSVLLIGVQVEANTQTIRFGRLTTADGLSNNRVYSILQDRYGFLWFGTDDGLNRYDGYEFRVYRKDPSDSTSISDNSIRSIIEDESGFLWIGTKGGELNRYNPATDSFEHWKIDPGEIFENSVTSLFKDSAGRIWIGTYKDGLYNFYPPENKFEHWIHKPNDPNSLTNNFITSIIEDHNGELWVSTYNGLNRFNPHSPDKPFDRMYRDDKTPTTLSDNLIWELHRSKFDPRIVWIGTLNGLTRFNIDSGEFRIMELPGSEGLQFGYSISSFEEDVVRNDTILWIGTFGGLIRINVTKGSSERILRDENNTYSINSNQIHAIFKDRSGVIWIATNEGLNYYSPKHAKFNFGFTGRIGNDLYKKTITAITQTSNGKLWFGSSDGLFSASRESFDRRSDAVPAHSYPETRELNIWSLATDENNKILIGTYGQGLKLFDPQSGTIKSFEVGYREYELTAAYRYIKSICRTRNGMIWIGYWGGGAARLNPVTGEYRIWRKEDDSPASLSYNDVWWIHEDRMGRIWLGTNGGGLNLFEDVNGEVFHHWKDEKSDNFAGLTSNSIHYIYESPATFSKDDETVLWIGTRNGLNKLVIQNKNALIPLSSSNVEISSYSVKSGLPDNFIGSIVQDDNGYLWLGTAAGISRFDPKSETFVNFSSADGLNGTDFVSGSVYSSADGLLFFGSMNGLNIFNPAEIEISAYHPPVIITDFLIFNQKVKPGETSALKTSIVEARNVSLSYKQNVFSFQFAALDFNSPASIRYAYMMEGFDTDWIFSGTRRFVTYTNLNPGTYIFKVKATNSDGIWSDNVASLHITITPPVWATWYAYIFYFLTILTGIYFIRNYELKKRARKLRERLRKSEEETALREMKLKAEAAELKAKTLEQEKEIEKQKMRIKISRDLHDDVGGTLSSIGNFVSAIQSAQNSSLDQSTRKLLSLIGESSYEAQEAINDIIWSIDPAHESWEAFFAKCRRYAFDMCESKSIQHVVHFPEIIPDGPVPLDARRNIWLIYKEIVTNAVKHSHCTELYIKVVLVNNVFQLLVRDNGNGFDPEAVTDRYGVKNIRTRATEINAQVELTTMPGNGTTWYVSVSL